VAARGRLDTPETTLVDEVGVGVAVDDRIHKLSLYFDVDEEVGAADDDFIMGRRKLFFVRMTGHVLLGESLLVIRADVDINTGSDVGVNSHESEEGVDMSGRAQLFLQEVVKVFGAWVLFRLGAAEGCWVSAFVPQTTALLE